MVKISVVCPTFNSAKFVEKTLATVVSQTRLPDEVVISDDGSSDNTLEVVRRFIEKHGVGINWRTIHNKHQGSGATRNAGIRETTSEWIAFLDSDDLWEEKKIERIVRAILSLPDVNFFCHDELLVDKNGTTSVLEYGRRYRSDYPLPPQLYFSNMFSTSAVACRRDLLIQQGCFDESLMSAQDYELWLRLSPFMRPAFLNEILGSYVERSGNVTSTGIKDRLRNEVRIAFMHRHKVSAPWVAIRLVRIMLSFARQFAHHKLGL
jgi:glycosyltransferase involved in cell wall biosynthesis